MFLVTLWGMMGKNVKEVFLLSYGFAEYGIRNASAPEWISINTSGLNT